MKSYREKFLDDLDLVDHSANTIEKYLGIVTRFFKIGCPDKNPTQVTEEDVRSYFLYIKRDRKNGISTQKSTLSALKFFLKQR